MRFREVTLSGAAGSRSDYDSGRWGNVSGDGDGRTAIGVALKVCDISIGYDPNSAFFTQVNIRTRPEIMVVPIAIVQAALVKRQTQLFPIEVECTLVLSVSITVAAKKIHLFVAIVPT